MSFSKVDRGAVVRRRRRRECDDDGETVILFRQVDRVIYTAAAAAASETCTKRVRGELVHLLVIICVRRRRRPSAGSRLPSSDSRNEREIRCVRVRLCRASPRRVSTRFSINSSRPPRGVGMQSENTPVRARDYYIRPGPARGHFV